MTVAKIMTGAPLPEGADAVVPYEWTDRGAERVLIEQAPRGLPARAVRRRGRPPGRRRPREPAPSSSPRHLGLLASIGRPSVKCGPRPRVVIVSTGSELREPGAELAADSIYEGNSFLLGGAARAGRAPMVPRRHRPRRAGGVPRRAPRGSWSDADLVVTSGGVSQGDYDVVKAALRPLGTVWFGGVAMQPGKPQGFGRGRRRTRSSRCRATRCRAYISFQVFVLPALRRMLGREPAALPWPTARLASRRVLAGGQAAVLARRVRPRRSNCTPVGGPGSHLVGDLAASNALIVVPEEATSLAAGDEVQMLRLDEEF